MKPTLAETIAFMEKAHAGQTYGDGPYALHPLRVMHRLPSFASDEDRMIALLHDVLEETAKTDRPITADDLRARGYSEYVVDGVVLLTPDPSKGSYMDRIRAIVASNHLGAMLAKLADNEENADPVRISLIADPADRQKRTDMADNRYRRSMTILRAGLRARGYNV